MSSDELERYFPGEGLGQESVISWLKTWVEVLEGRSKDYRKPASVKDALEMLHQEINNALDYGKFE